MAQQSSSSSRPRGPLRPRRATSQDWRDDGDDQLTQSHRSAGPAARSIDLARPGLDRTSARSIIAYPPARSPIRPLSRRSRNIIRNAAAQRSLSVASQRPISSRRRTAAMHRHRRSSLFDPESIRRWRRSPRASARSTSIRWRHAPLCRRSITAIAQLRRRPSTAAPSADLSGLESSCATSPHRSKACISRMSYRRDRRAAQGSCRDRPHAHRSDAAPRDRSAGERSAQARRAHRRQPQRRRRSGHHRAIWSAGLPMCARRCAALKPAESLAGFEEAIRNLSRKIDQMAASAGPDQSCSSSKPRSRPCAASSRMSPPTTQLIGLGRRSARACRRRSSVSPPCGDRIQLCTLGRASPTSPCCGAIERGFSELTSRLLELQRHSSRPQRQRERDPAVDDLERDLAAHAGFARSRASARSAIWSIACAHDRRRHSQKRATRPTAAARCRTARNRRNRRRSLGSCRRQVRSLAPRCRAADCVAPTPRHAAGRNRSRAAARHPCRCRIDPPPARDAPEPAPPAKCAADAPTHRSIPICRRIFRSSRAPAFRARVRPARRPNASPRRKPPSARPSRRAPTIRARPISSRPRAAPRRPRRPRPTAPDAPPQDRSPPRPNKPARA